MPDLSEIDILLMLFSYGPASQSHAMVGAAAQQQLRMEDPPTALTNRSHSYAAEAAWKCIVHRYQWHFTVEVQVCKVFSARMKKLP